MKKLRNAFLTDDDMHWLTSLLSTREWYYIDDVAKGICALADCPLSRLPKDKLRKRLLYIASLNKSFEFGIDHKHNSPCIRYKGEAC